MSTAGVSHTGARYASGMARCGRGDRRIREPVMRLVLLLPLAACTTPTAGTYAVTITQIETSCPDDFFPLAAPNEDIEVDVNAALTEVTLVLVVDEACPLDGLAFTCPYASQDDTVDHNADGIDAVYTTEAGITGEWGESDSFTAVTSLSSTCEGAGCAELAEQGEPECTVAWYWSGELPPA